MHIVSTEPHAHTGFERDRHRIAPLSVLPVFFDLKGKKVLVCGGSEAAAWKAQLLAAAGAHVHVHAPELDPDFAGLLAEGACTWQRRNWDAQSFTDMYLAVADFETDAEAETFFSAAKEAGVPCNVIDKPAFCHFQFGAIVNRSPVVVGISTSGAAPILGQAVRRRIETLLPDFLSAWAGIAENLRALVMRQLTPGAERRAFWERFADAAFRSAPAGETLAAWIADAGTVRPGRVTLVGAGPGDADYLTIKAVRALQSADVILFDDDVPDEILELARREAKRIAVGRRGGRKTCRPEAVGEVMVALARKGRHVVRLRSGDAMISGRTGAEIARLLAENIAVEMVPGITTAEALAAEFSIAPPTMIPSTRRAS